MIDVRRVKSPKAFFKKYVAQRRPVILRGLLPELASLPEEWWAAPSARSLRVDVEKRRDVHDTFGKGHRVSMRFGDLLKLLKSGDTTHYLTTQEGSGEEELLTAPLTAVASQLPLRPDLLRTLVPQTINLWLGRTDRLTSSGLHHDYHDNLYCLLRGKKRFRLFSPVDAHKMYTHGTIARIHANGRINYEEDAPTVPDGRTVSEVHQEALKRAKRAQHAAESALEQAERAAEEAAASGAAEADGELEALLSARVSSAEAHFEATMDKVMRLRVAARTSHKRSASTGNQRGAEGSVPGGDSSGSSDVPPPNFCKVSSLADSTVLRRYPRLSEASMVECEIRANEMLFLPAGWFHEVSSLGEHCALNYWFHPPDTRDFERPYRAASFWKREWRRVAALTRHTQRAD